MKRLLITLFITCFPFVIWADTEILSQQHNRPEDYHTAWGGGLDTLAPTFSLPKPNPQSLPAHDNRTAIISAKGKAWCWIQTGGAWQLVSAEAGPSQPAWRLTGLSMRDEALRFALNQHSDLSVMVFDKREQSFVHHIYSIHSGGNEVSLLESIPLAGSSASAELQWRDQVGDVPLLVGEFDLGEAGEFLALSHSAVGAGTMVRYRISPGYGQPYSPWSNPVPAGSSQLKKDGQYLQYQILSKENALLTSFPDFSVTYTYPQYKHSNIHKGTRRFTGGSGYADPKQNNPGHGDAGSSNGKPNNESSDDSKPDDGNKQQTEPENKEQNGNTTSTTGSEQQTGSNRESDSSTSGSESTNGEESSGEEQSQTDSETNGNEKETQNPQTQENNPQEDSPHENGSGEQGEESNKQPSNPNPQNQPNNENKQQPNDTPSNEKPSFSSPLNHVIGKPNQNPAPQQDETRSKPQSNAPNADDSKPEPQPQSNQPAEPEPQSEPSSTASTSEEMNRPNAGQGGNPNQYSPSGGSGFSPGSGNPPASNSGADNGSPQMEQDSNHAPAGGAPQAELGNSPVGGMPNDHSDAPGFSFPNMGGGSGSVTSPTRGSSQGNSSTGNSGQPLSNGNKPGKPEIASPTISRVTPGTGSPIARLQNKEESSSSIPKAVPMTGGAGLLSILFWLRNKKRSEKVDINPADHENADEKLLSNDMDEFTSGEKLLYMMIPKREDSVWDTAIAFDPSVIAVDANDKQIVALHDDGTLRLEKDHSITALGTWKKQGNMPQIASTGLPFYAVGLNIKGQLNVCQGKQAAKSHIEEQRPISLPTGIHEIKQMAIKNQRMYVIGESFEKSVLLSAPVKHGKVGAFKPLVPQDAPEGEAIGMATSGKELIAYSAKDEPGIVRIYQWDDRKRTWELLAKAPCGGRQVRLCMDEKRCFMADWNEDDRCVSIHAFTRDENGRFKGHYVNEIELPFDAKISSGTFQNGRFTLQGKQTTPKGETRIVSCSAWIRKLLGIPATVS